MVCPFRKEIVHKPDRDIETYPECYGYSCPYHTLSLPYCKRVEKEMKEKN